MGVNGQCKVDLPCFWSVQVHLAVKLLISSQSRALLRAEVGQKQKLTVSLGTQPES